MTKKEQLRRRKALIKKRKRQRRFRIFLLCFGFSAVLLLGGYLVYHIMQFLTPGSDGIASEIKAAEVKATDSKTPKLDQGTVVIDAGHGGYDGGAEGVNGILEKDVTLKIALDVKTTLEKQGIKVIMTRDSDEVSWPSVEISDLTARTNISNDSGADLFLSIHTNATEVMNDGSSGTEVWTMMINDTNVNFANQIEEQLEQLGYTHNRGVKDEADRRLAVLNKNYVPGVLVEIGFLSDQADCAYLSQATGQKAIAKALSQGIITTLQDLRK